MSTQLKYAKPLFFLLFFNLTISSCVFASCRSLSFDDIRSEGGFGSRSLLTVSSMRGSGNALTEIEKEALVSSDYLKNIHTISLVKQDLDDNFIERLCRNKSLNRLVNLDVSENEKITNKSLRLILNSDLGSVRDLPQISGRFGIPSSTIYVTAKKTSVRPETSDKHEICLHRFNFSVFYIHPVTEEETDSPADYAVKFVECNF